MSPITSSREQGRHRLIGLAAIGGTLAAAASALTSTGALASDITLYGDPAWAAQFWVAQTQDHDCVLMSSADVVGQVTGRSVSEAEIIQVASQLTDPSTGQSIYDPSSGSSIEYVPLLLQQYGVQAEVASGGTIDQLESDLGRGFAVIVSVDGEKIWNVTDPSSQMQDPDTHDHEVVVTGVDPQYVYLNDSGDANVGRAEKVPVDVFTQSWATSGDALAVTTQRVLDPALQNGSQPAQNSQPGPVSVTSGGAGGVNPNALAVLVIALLTAAAGAVLLAARRRRQPAPVPQWSTGFAAQPAPFWTAPVDALTGNGACQQWAGEITQPWPPQAWPAAPAVPSPSWSPVLPPPSAPPAPGSWGSVYRG
ncbi:MAG TPA: C39 family peptidase [Candidatus Binatia bacterium]|nr:C39 family peptidase [Candidatus Binatia bacterium]